MNIPTIHPAGLKKGDTIAIVAPAGPIQSRPALYDSAAVLERMGFRVLIEERIFSASRYLAGSDLERADALMRAFTNDSVRAVIGLRGGYGCSRLIPYLDRERLGRNPKLFMGFSDLITLHLFFHRYFGWVTLHGPMAVNPGIGACTEEQLAHLSALWTDPGYRPVLEFPQLESWNPGRAEGRLVGGCLSTVVASLGTPYEIDTRDAILFLEDVGEAPYRLDRMLTQLRLARKTDSLSGVLLGTFHECDPPTGDYSLPEVLREILGQFDVPVLAHFPAGHGPENWALPLGARVRIDSDARRVELLEPAVS